MRAAILLVGHELLSGHTRDSNGHWMAGQLHRRGTPLDCILTIDDTPVRIAAALVSLAKGGCDLILVSGGLGGTHDDTTLRGVALAMGVPLEVDPAILTMVERHWRRGEARRGRSDLSAEQVQTYLRRMATVPLGSIGLPNRVGIAAGIRVRVMGATVVCMPGVPSELQDIFADAIEPLLGNHPRPFLQEVRCVARESELFPHLDALVLAHPSVVVGSYPQSGGIVTVRLEGAQAAVEAAAAQFLTALPPGTTAVTDLSAFGSVDPDRGPNA